MPTVNFSPLRTTSYEDIIDYIVGLQRDLNYYLMNLDTQNIDRLDAKVIIANTITAEKMNVTELSAISANLGEVTAGIITGLLIRTATTGRRIVLNGSQLSSYNTDTLDGFTLDGSDGFLRWYNAGVETGIIGRDNSQPYEQFLFSHDYILLSGSQQIYLSSPSIAIGDVGSNVYLPEGSSSVGSLSQSDSTATTVAGIVSDFNSLLSKLRSMGILA